MRPRHLCVLAHQVDIQIERAAEPLDQGYCSGLGRLTGKARLIDQMCGNATVDDAQHLTHDGRAAAGQRVSVTPSIPGFAINGYHSRIQINLN